MSSKWKVKGGVNDQIVTDEDICRRCKWNIVTVDGDCIATPSMTETVGEEVCKNCEPGSKEHK